MPPHNEMLFSKFFELGGAPELIDEARWATYPTWLAADVCVLLNGGKKNEAHASAALRGSSSVTLRPLQLYVSTLNAYSALDSGTLLPLSRPLLYHALSPGSIPLDPSALVPLLPLSQEYPLSSFQTAVRARAFLVFWQERHLAAAHERRKTRAWDATMSGATQTWGRDWHGYEEGKRATLCRAVWNASVKVLEGGPAPYFEQVVLAQVPPPPLGGARPFRLPSGAHMLVRVATSAENSHAAFSSTLRLVVQFLHAHFPHAASGYGQECVRLLGQHGGMDGLEEGQRRRLLVEMLVVYQRLPRWHTKVASPEQLFECLALTPTIPCPEPLILHHPSSLIPQVHLIPDTPSLAPQEREMHSLAHYRRHQLVRAPAEPSIGVRTARRMGRRRRGGRRRRRGGVTEGGRLGDGEEALGRVEEDSRR
ncbi:hypothetical protein JCM6882_002796 [Rhodosporidiobolus microsporus]